MRLSLSRYGFYCTLRYAEFSGDNRAIGFVVKLKSRRLFSERHGGWKGFTVGPLYFRTYRRNTIGGN